MRRTLALLLFLFVGCTTITKRGPQHPEARFPGHQFDHVVIIVLENEDNSVVMRNPYMKRLAESGRSFAHFSGLFHPSYANYLALVAGDFFHTRLDFQKDIDAPTVADLLEKQGLTWKQYAENYPPGGCFTKAHTPDRLYYRKHVPFLSFKSIQDPKRCVEHVFPADRFDWHDLPSYAFFTPNMKNDGHDTSLEVAAKWLEGFLAPVLEDHAVLKDTLIVVTFDESATYAGNSIYTVFLGDMVKPGVDPNPYDHYNLLRTIEDNFGLGTLGAIDKESGPIASAWK